MAVAWAMAAAALGPGNDTAGTQSRPVKVIVSLSNNHTCASKGWY